MVWLRQDPPFDMGYITTTHLLDMIHPDTLVVNDPFWVRNSPEKLLVLRFPRPDPADHDRARPRHLARLQATEHGDIILKPLYGNGGAGVFRLDPDDRNLASLHELFTGMNREPLIVQKFLPDGGQGRQADHPGRRRAGGRDQPGAGGGRDPLQHACRRTAEKIGLTDARPRDLRRDRPAAASEKGLVFVGIDVIGDWLTEINVTSPTGIQELERFDGTNIAAMIWEAIEARRT